MTRASLRGRLRGAADVRFLTDGEAEALLGTDTVIDQHVTWVEASASYTRMQVTVLNVLSEALALTGQVKRDRPGTSSWALIWGAKQAHEHPESIRRLDLRATHRNPDGTLWRNQTHKHRWSSADNNRWAYTPDDIPHDESGGAVCRDDYRAIFEAFAAECGIALGPGYRWTDPVLGLPADQKELWEP